MAKDLLYLIELNTVQFDESTDTASSWIHALPVGEYQHPVYGKMSMTAEKIKAYADSVINKVRGIDPSINYNHNNQDIASGWVKNAEARDTGLWVFVEWTKAAVEKIKNKEYRYFSAEFDGEWKNPEGKVFKDVFFGGALTNRPYMKNLVPINLAETTIEAAIGLAAAIQKGKEGEKDMDLVKFAKAVGLAETATEDEVFKALAEKLTPPAPDKKDDKKTPEVPSVKLSEELKRLSEDNPMVKALIETVDSQNKALHEFQKSMVESTINAKLAEFDNSQIILTPVAKDKIHDLLVAMPVNLHEQMWEVLGLMKSSSGLLVELGERAGAAPRYGKSKDAVSLFMDEVTKTATEKKITLDEAMGEVSRNNPDLWNQYRAGSYAFTE